MGNITGNLKIALHSPPGKIPVQATNMCITHLEQGSGRSLHLGECNPTSSYSVSSDGEVLGYFSGCPTNIGVQPLKAAESPPTPPRSAVVTGTCSEFPFSLAVKNNQLRQIIVLVVALLAGLTVAGGMLAFYRHSDGSDESIYPA